MSRSEYWKVQMWRNEILCIKHLCMNQVVRLLKKLESFRCVICTSLHICYPYNLQPVLKVQGKGALFLHSTVRLPFLRGELEGHIYLCSRTGLGAICGTRD